MDMKKTTLFVIGLMLATTLMAGPVGKDEAKVKAQAFLSGKAGGKSGVAKAPRQQRDLSLAATGDAYHVFNIGSGDGFVIVSASDLTPDIIGYTDEGAFDVQNMPDNMKEWLQGYADQIVYLEKNGVSSAAEAKGLRKAPASVKAPIAPLIETKWGQSDPYNYLCPKVSETYCQTGCVATAMAQILYYHNQKEGFPVSTVKKIDAYTKGVSVEECPVTTFDWSNMQKTYTGKETTVDVKAQAVAKLMQYCGASVGMNYGTGSSGASSSDIPQALVDYFGYDQRVKYLRRSHYSTSEWENIIYQELEAKRPVYYSGSSTGGGHAFVCDGFSEDGYFHINWGWTGRGDGYFLLSVLNPNERGVGAGSSNDGYTIVQDIVIGIEKPTGSPELEDGRMAVHECSYTGTTTLGRSSSCTVSYHFWLYNELSYKHDFDFALALYDESDNRLAVSTSYSLDAVAVNAGRGGTRSSSFNFTSSAVPNGTYKLKLVSKEKGASEWQKCFGADDYYIQMVADASNVTFTNVTPTVNLAVSEVTPTECMKGALTTITATIKNNGTRFNGELFLLLEGISGAVAGNGVSVEAGEKVIATFTFRYDDAAPVIKTMKIATDEAGANVIWTGSLTVQNGVSDNTPTLTSTHHLNVDESNTYILGEKLVDRVTLTNTSPTTAYEGRVYLSVYKFEGGTGTPTNTEMEKVVVPPSSSIDITYEMDVAIDEVYSVQAYYHHSDNWAIASPDVVFTKYTAKPAVTILAADGTKSWKLAEASLTVPTDAAVVDLRGQSVVTSITPNSNPNTLYLANSDPIGGITKNWVNGTTAANVELVDDGTHGFYTPIDFTATKISYKRTFTTGATETGGGWNTLMVPFAVNAVKVGGSAIDWFKSGSDTGKNFWLYQFASDGKGTVNFDYAASIEANTPYLINVPSDAWGAENQLTGKEITFEGSSATVKADVRGSQSGFYYMFTGNTQKQAVTNSYVLNADGTEFAKTTGDVEPFRAYFYGSSHNLQTAALAIGFVDNNEATGITELTAGCDEETADGAWYTLSGVKLTGKPTEKGIYIYHGKKVAIK